MQHILRLFNLSSTSDGKRQLVDHLKRAGYRVYQGQPLRGYGVPINQGGRSRADIVVEVNQSARGYGQLWIIELKHLPSSNVHSSEQGKKLGFETRLFHAFDPTFPTTLGELVQVALDKAETFKGLVVGAGGSEDNIYTVGAVFVGSDIYYSFDYTLKELPQEEQYEAVGSKKCWV
jgi:hypothetical protein